MLIVLETTIQALERIVQNIPMGTNLALIQLMWMMLQGSLLSSRGGIFPALIMSGFSCETARRCWAAMRYGQWESRVLIQSFQEYVEEEGKWEGHEYEGYKPVAIDLTAFWRPHLKGWIGKHFNSIAKRALPAITFGIAVQIGSVGKKRVPILKIVVRPDKDNPSDKDLTTGLLEKVGQELAEDEIAVLDAGFKLAGIKKAGIKQAIVRLAKNATARRNEPKAHKGGRKPVYGEIIRPLERTFNGKEIPASEPDFTEQFELNGEIVQVKGWRDLILALVVPDPDNDTFDIYLFEHPQYDNPLVLAQTIRLSPESCYYFYQDRWAVEQVPLSAKQIIGAGRQFVFALESCFRWSELALIVGSILIYLAAVLPAVPTGFWDRQPKNTPGRLRRVIARCDFPKAHQFLAQIRKKASVTDHLPKGIMAHRRVKAET